MYHCSKLLKAFPQSWLILSLLGFCLSVTAQASSPAPTISSATVISEVQYLKVFIVLVLIIALLVVSAKLIKRFNLGKNFSDSHIKILSISSLGIGSKERIAIIQVADVTLLVGITSQQISLLHQFGDSASVEEQLKKNTDKSFLDYLNLSIKDQK